MHELILFGALGAALFLATLLPRWGTFAWIGWAYSLFALGIRGVGLSDVFAIFASLRREPRSPGSPRPPYAGVLGLVVALGLCALLTSLWSPSPTASLATGLRWLSLAALLPYAYSLTTKGSDPLVRVLLSLSPLAIVEALTVIAFRFDPALEHDYYVSRLSGLLLGSTGHSLYTSQLTANNVLELDRAGGIFFVNCNRASMVMGVLMVTYLAIWLWSRRGFLLVPAGLLAIAVSVSGSKTGLALLVALPIIAIVMARVAHHRDPGAKLALLVTALISLGAAAQYTLAHATGYVTKSQETLVPRLGLWREAVAGIESSPVLGLGFGGWEKRWEAGQVHLAFLARPAHNVLLQAWLDGGLVYALLHVAFAVAVIWLALRGVSRGGQRSEVQMRTFALAGFLWLLVHGMGDNTAMYGDPLTVVPLAIIIAILSRPAWSQEEVRSRELDLASPSSRGPEPRSGPTAERGSQRRTS